MFIVSRAMPFTSKTDKSCNPSFDLRDPQRLAALRSYAILDTPSEPEFDDIAQMAAQACSVPMAHINFIDADRQWIKAAVGHDTREMPLHFGFCTEAMREDGILILPNLKAEPGLADNPLVTGEPHLRFYAGVPLVTPDGWAIGTLCVLDREPRMLTEQQEFILKALARTVMAQLESRRSQATLREREAEIRLVADAMPVLIAFIDRSLTYRFANAAYQTWMGMPPEEVVGQTVIEIMGIEEFEVRRPYIDQVLAGQEVQIERLWPCPDGRVRVADIRYMPRVAANNAPDGFYVFVHDVSDRKHVEDLLETRASRLEEQVASQTRDRDRIWTLSPVLKVIAKLDGRIQSVNPSWTWTLGWLETETVNRPLLDFVAAEDGEQFNGILSQLTDTMPTDDIELSFMTRDGHKRRILWTLVPEEELLYGFGRDVTEQRLAEEALRQSQKMEAVGQLTGGLAHDFNNLLAGISGSLELMQTRLQQGRFNDVERYMSAAQGAAKRASALTHRLLAFSRRQTLDPKPTNVNRLAAGMQELIQRTVGPAILVEVVGAAGIWPALVDPSQLENALLNLCINARDAMPNGGRITIETANRWLDRCVAKQHDIPEGQYLSMCVTDTGTGMPPDVVAKAFDPFFTTKPLGEGTGLGLSMIYGFAQQSGGQVRIYSEVGHGTTVCIYLPRHYGEVAEEDKAQNVVQLQRSEQDRTVLIVDDEPTVRMLVTDILEDLGYTAIEAGDSVAGLKVLQSDVRIDLLITDVGLPGGINGRQMADAGREKRRDLQVLFITGYAENAAIGNGYLEPGMQVLTKPFAMEALASRVREMIEKRQ